MHLLKRDGASMREAIARHGYWGTWRGRRYRYLDVAGWKYWYIPPVLNREPVRHDDV
jgi:hypothetical protein